MIPLDLAIELQRREIKSQLLDLARQRIAADLDRALTILGGVVATRPAVHPSLPDGGASLPHWSGSIGQQTAPVPKGMTEPGRSISSGWRDAANEEINRRLGL